MARLARGLDFGGEVEMQAGRAVGSSAKGAPRCESRSFAAPKRRCRRTGRIASAPTARQFGSRSVFDAEARVRSIRFAAEVARGSVCSCLFEGELPVQAGSAGRCAGDGTSRDKPAGSAFTAEVVASACVAGRLGSDAAAPSELSPCAAEVGRHLRERRGSTAADQVAALIKCAERTLQVRLVTACGRADGAAGLRSRSWRMRSSTARACCAWAARTPRAQSWPPTCWSAGLGPLLAFDGWRGAVASVNKGKTAELKDQAAAIAQTSGLQGCGFLRTPAPGRIAGPSGRLLEVLSADARAGHASGLMTWWSMISVQSRNGTDPAKRAAQLDQCEGWADAASDCPRVTGRLSRSWHSRRPTPLWRCICTKHRRGASPPTGGVARGEPRSGARHQIGLAYMRDRFRLAASNPADAADFRGHDLNMPGNPSAESICTVAHWQRCQL